MLIVKKFGGTSVGNTERIFNVAKRCIEDWQRGNDVVVVLSAMGKYTDELIDMAKQVNENPPKREMDMLFTIGEQMSVSLMAMAMNSLKVPAISLNAFQVAMHTTSVYGNARLKRIDVERIRHELEQRKIVIVTGFQGINKYDDYTTLGRGGSDTTAVALAAALNADACEIYTDVDGVYTADPRKVKTARKLDTITYDEMLELATLGAGVLHNRSVELAKKFGVQLVVRSSLNFSFKLFNLLAKNDINIDMILQSVGRHGTKDITFTCSDENADKAEEIIKNNIGKFESIDVNKNVAKVSIVGAGMQSNAGVAAKMFEALYDENINIRMISTSEIRVTVLIDEQYTERAMNAIHDKFALGDR